MIRGRHALNRIVSLANLCLCFSALATSLTSCTRDIVISSASAVTTQVQRESDELPYKVGIVIPVELSRDTVRHIHHRGELTTTLEFQLGKDMAKLLPAALRTMARNVQVLDDYRLGTMAGLDVLVMPDISASKVDAYSRFSAGISYELHITLKVTLIQNDRIIRVTTLGETWGDEVPAIDSTGSDNRRITEDYDGALERLMAKFKQLVREVLVSERRSQ